MPYGKTVLAAAKAAHLTLAEYLEAEPRGYEYIQCDDLDANNTRASIKLSERDHRRETRTDVETWRGPQIRGSC